MEFYTGILVGYGGAMSLMWLSLLFKKEKQYSKRTIRLQVTQEWYEQIYSAIVKERFATGQDDEDYRPVQAYLYSIFHTEAETDRIFEQREN